MNGIVYLFYVAIVGLIRIYKWIEFRVLLLFTPYLTKKGIEIGESIGVIFHFPGDDQDCVNENPNRPDSEECDKLLAKTSGKYNSLVHIKVNNKRYFARAANLGTLGCGEAWMDGDWDVYDNNVEDVTEFATRTLENNLLDKFYNPWNKTLEWLELYAFNLQTRERAFQVGLQHYDLGNDLYERMLDPSMQYTCGYWKNAVTLSEAQNAKMDLVAKKLELKPQMRVLDIGCGWGTLCKYLSENYKVECVGLTISTEGLAYGKKICEGLPVDIRLQDYREVNEKFDRIVSVGMFEAVGDWNAREYFEVARRCLKDDGIFLLHTIGRNHYNYPQRSDPCDKFIFPNGQVPSPIDIAERTKNLFVIEDWHNFGLDYAKTLFCWRENFMREWPKIQEKYYGEQFYRMWICYLSLARALFKSRRLHLWQIVLTKDGLKRDYRAHR